MAGRHDHTSMGGAARQFPPTEWTAILSGPRHEQVLEELCRRYWKPIYHYLRALGYGNEQAKDLVQGFFTDKVLGQELVEKADRQRGRFRNFLLRAVRNYTASLQRADRIRRSTESDGTGRTCSQDPGTQFNRAWADQLLDEVLRELETECCQRGKATHWLIFRDWLLDAATDAGGRKMAEIAGAHGIDDPAKAYHMIENLKRRFRAILRTRLGQSIQSAEEIEVEIRDFIDIFSGRAAR